MHTLIHTCAHTHIQPLFPQIAEYLPELLEDIQLQLLDLLSLALAKRPFNQFTPPSKVQALNAALTTGVCVCACVCVCLCVSA